MSHVTRHNTDNHDLMTPFKILALFMYLSVHETFDINYEQFRDCPSTLNFIVLISKKSMGHLRFKCFSFLHLPRSCFSIQNWMKQVRICQMFFLWKVSHYRCCFRPTRHIRQIAKLFQMHGIWRCTGIRRYIFSVKCSLKVFIYEDVFVPVSIA